MPASGGPAAAGRSHGLARSLLLLLWTLVLWGTLVLAGLVWRSLEQGPAAAIGMLVSDAADVSPVWGRVSLACAVLAVVVWTMTAVVLVRRRRGAAEREDTWR